MIAKTLPAIYRSDLDTFLKKKGDTLYYKEQYFTGYQYSLYENGDSAFIYGFFNGVEEGWQRKYYPGKVLAEQRFYVNGKKEGSHKSWWPDGKSRMEFTAEHNEYEGEFKEWNSAGTLIKRFHYIRGKEAGRQQLWWDNGKLRANYEVRNGRTFGLIGSKLCMNPNDSIN
jgi:antitoxin component YwqK of YwqJK toxin-antitoxin module